MSSTSNRGASLGATTLEADACRRLAVELAADAGGLLAAGEREANMSCHSAPSDRAAADVGAIVCRRLAAAVGRGTVVVAAAGAGDAGIGGLDLRSTRGGCSATGAGVAAGVAAAGGWGARGCGCGCGFSVALALTAGCCGCCRAGNGRETGAIGVAVR